jgi:hypothetical protein
MKTKYSGHEISPSEVTDIPSLVDMHVRKFIALKREQLWKTHRAFVVSAVQEALPSPLRDFETYYTDVVLKLVFKHLGDSRPENWPTENFQEWLKKNVHECLRIAIPTLVNDSG